MIVTKPRPIERILENLASVDARRVFIVGCGSCATSADAGGEPQVAQLATTLEEAGFEVTGSFVPESTCNIPAVSLQVRKSGMAEKADAVVVLSCGSGVQVVADIVPSIPVFPGLDSLFVGNSVRHGSYVERCQLCGTCGLDKTAGICPLTACPKGIVNGPCGGMWDGRCEVLNDRECVHVLIYRRLQEQGRPMPAARPVSDNTPKLHPGSHTTRERKNGEGSDGNLSR